MVFKNQDLALPGVAEWVECRSANGKVAGLIPSRGMCLGCGPGPLLGAFERQPIDISLAHQCFSPSISSSLPLSLERKK